MPELTSATDDALQALRAYLPRLLQQVQHRAVNVSLYADVLRREAPDALDGKGLLPEEHVQHLVDLHRWGLDVLAWSHQLDVALRVLSPDQQPAPAPVDALLGLVAGMLAAETAGRVEVRLDAPAEVGSLPIAPAALFRALLATGRAAVAASPAHGEVLLRSTLCPASETCPQACVRLSIETVDTAAGGWQEIAASPEVQEALPLHSAALETSPAALTLLVPHRSPSAEE